MLDSGGARFQHFQYETVIPYCGIERQLMTVPSMMGRRVVIAPDKFKGSLTAGQAARAMALGVKRADPELTTGECPVAAGGDAPRVTAGGGGFERVPVSAEGPTRQVVLPGHARTGKSSVV